MPSKTTDTVFFFGKQRKLNVNGEFKLGRQLRVSILPETAKSKFWHAELFGYGADVSVTISGARSRAAAAKKLERRVDLLYRTIKKLHDGYGNG